MKNKYETGITDSFNNSEYDFIRVCKDMKDVIRGKKKFTKSLYEVMSTHFTIAHYNMYGWLDYYNRNWGELADELHTMRYGNLEMRPEYKQAIIDLKEFLRDNNGVDICKNM